MSVYYVILNRQAAGVELDRDSNRSRRWRLIQCWELPQCRFGVLDESCIPAENLWNEFIVPVFIERFLLVVCAAAFYGLVITNTMSFNGLQRIGLGCTLIGVALFLGATVHKQAHPHASAQPPSPPAAINQSASSSPCSNVIAGKNVTISCPPSSENKDAPKPRPTQEH
jgi:hypothetical protein